VQWASREDDVWAAGIKGESVHRPKFARKEW